MAKALTFLALAGVALANEEEILADTHLSRHGRHGFRYMTTVDPAEEDLQLGIVTEIFKQGMKEGAREAVKEGTKGTILAVGGATLDYVTRNSDSIKESAGNWSERFATAEYPRYSDLVNFDILEGEEIADDAFGLTSTILNGIGKGVEWVNKRPRLAKVAKFFFNRADDELIDSAEEDLQLGIVTEIFKQGMKEGAREAVKEGTKGTILAVGGATFDYVTRNSDSIKESAGNWSERFATAEYPRYSDLVNFDILEGEEIADDAFGLRTTILRGIRKGVVWVNKHPRLAKVANFIVNRADDELIAYGGEDVFIGF